MSGPILPALLGEAPAKPAPTIPEEVAIEDSSDSYEPLPSEFVGAKTLTMPAYLPRRTSGMTLPSRLDTLGNQEFGTFSAITSVNVGNAVVGFTIPFQQRVAAFFGLQTKYLDTEEEKAGYKRTYFVLPFIFSTSLAYVVLFLRLVALFVVGILIIYATNLVVVNVGQWWAIGTAITMAVLFELSKIRFQRDGVMSFCRAMGQPAVEEMMFSYSWKVEDENIRTLAKAVWNAGVGVWIDVVKLTPGDEIRPVVRTMVRLVHRCVVFLSPAYMDSPNCCVEFWEAVQRPNNLIICVLEPCPAVMDYLHVLEVKGAKLVTGGISALIPVLDAMLADTTDISAYLWWKNQKIVGAGVPNNVVPHRAWNVPMFRFRGSPFVPNRSLTVGPGYIAGDCLSTGKSMRVPWLLIAAAIAFFLNLSIAMGSYLLEREKHTRIDIAWLVVMAFLNATPFISIGKLMDTRYDCATALRPLLASRAMGEGVMVEVVGEQSDPVVKTLRKFLEMVGHLFKPKSDQLVLGACDACADEHGATFWCMGCEQSFCDAVAALHRSCKATKGHQLIPGGQPLSTPPCDAHTQNRHESFWFCTECMENYCDESAKAHRTWTATKGHRLIDSRERNKQMANSAVSMNKSNQFKIQVHVMSTLAHRDVLFGSDELPFDPRTTLFVWTGKAEPFTKDAIGTRMMRTWSL